MIRVLACVALALPLSLAGCSENRGSGVSYESGVIASLAANANIGAATASTFQADVRSGWAITYDPASPPGCTPGGLAPSGPLAERPCRAYVLERMKTTWLIRAVGVPGQMEVPKGAPEDLGDPKRLSYLGGGASPG